MEIQVANLAGMFADGQQASQDDRKRSALAKFLQPAMAGDKAAVTGLYGAGAGAEAMQAQQYGQGQQKDAREELGKVAAAYAQTKNPQLYGRMRELTQASGLGHDMPESLTDPADIDGSLQFATAIAQAYGGGKPAELPTSVQEYQYAQKDPRFMEFLGAKTPQQLATINVPGGTQQVWANPRMRTIEDLEGNQIGGSQPQPSGHSGASSLMGSSFDDAVGRVLKTEGGYVANDAGKGPTNFGINSAANPGVDVAKLTADGAKDIYKRQYWDAINADQLPPAIRMAAFDTAVNMGAQRALELVRASGGDPQKFAALRQQKYDGLVAANPQKFGQYADGWRNRNHESAGVTPAQGGRLGFKKAEEKGKDAPSGYQWAEDGVTLKPIEGGPADRRGKGVENPAELAREEGSLRKELTALNKEPNIIINAYKKVQAAATQPSAANDLALIFGYMKMLDPNSVVRETEFANAQNAAGIDDRVKNAWNKVLEGERLNPAQRAQFLSSARQLHDMAVAQTVENTHQYGDMANQYGFDPVRATGSKLATPESRQKFEQAGDLLQDARDAIKRGAPKDAVRKRLIEQGFKNVAGRL